MSPFWMAFLAAVLLDGIVVATTLFLCERHNRPFRCYALLSALDRHGPATGFRLARALGVPEARLWPDLHQAKRGGLVVSRTDGVGRRVWSLTLEGRIALGSAGDADEMTSSVRDST